jgi:hypothetical protein
MNNPNTNLELVIKNSDLKEFTKVYAELTIDAFIDEGVLKDIPVLGTVIGVMKFGNSIHRHLTAKKIYKFLYQLNSIPQEKRIAKINEINESRKYQSSVGEMIFEKLDKIESDGKPEIIGKLFAAYIEEKIDFQIYLRLAFIVKSLFYYDLLDLKNITKKNVVTYSINDSIATSGLIETDMIYINENDTEKKPQITLTSLGEFLILLGMK